MKTILILGSISEEDSRIDGKSPIKNSDDFGPHYIIDCPYILRVGDQINCAVGMAVVTWQLYDIGEQLQEVSVKEL